METQPKETKDDPPRCSQRTPQGMIRLAAEYRQLAIETNDASLLAAAAALERAATGGNWNSLSDIAARVLARIPDHE